MLRSPTTTSSPTIRPPSSSKPFKKTLAQARAGFADLGITVEDVMAEGDRVATAHVQIG